MSENKRTVIIVGSYAELAGTALLPGGAEARNTRRLPLWSMAARCDTFDWSR